MNINLTKPSLKNNLPYPYKYYSKIILPIFLILLLIPYTTPTYYKKLHFNTNQEFTILQLTDLHYGEGPNRDHNSTILTERLLNMTNPDLVVITGDSVSGYAWDGLNNTFYSDCWEMWTSPLTKLGIPYAYTLGNHDDQGDYTRKQICNLDSTNKLSLTQYNPSVTGATNYFVPIYSSNKTDTTDKTPVSLIWMLDTNDENCGEMQDSWGCFEEDQIKWYENESERLNKKFGYTPKGLAFFHIPLPEYIDSYNWRKSYGTKNEEIACPKINTKLFKSMLEKDNIYATFCGHNHNNDNGAELYGIELVFGRKTGYGGYGPDFFQRGARVIKLKEVYDEVNKRMGYTYRHYVVQEDGSVLENSRKVWKGLYDFVGKCVR